MLAESLKKKNPQGIFGLISRGIHKEINEEFLEEKMKESLAVGSAETSKNFLYNC